ncbi:hypothetical protein A3H65_03955 [Candidatus Giovannonibacteria bacterium RIFCSPLOWO2_02_FULL_45_14]|uniref:Glycosyl transferase family 1 domain-containing protein n=1 Tax=Candidatus Giovannonibacteria bacterium RIFCSPLOWO2_12_FULL_44_15 TaxID=1798364 RepID=A0A1F5Y109_9BACT|nr:MAG: hypothetical protein A3C75_00340 [Candidatus Giovannonibacteria bacterium RIFCSPHIGHO2_02_FULL_44_31]OGF76752.1 MAG: hypothetical protein A3E62_02775 [Candidatus Giovannonibacteria bacterium RIFCSPHIGHO2_12_FULL_44_29]OGF91217.1 MAG: hypothetical protein A3H65_03955 [Candidatus Giovannonibacteria bacterium RIFCSPLOWO2_02_FULL_45_14]OGF93763.1 MAG: hypothetical protein A3G54_02445 [Candidatus Giovannonibacteria bacterium RIFCSPLOWO2_12_FULL_44_15]
MEIKRGTIVIFSTAYLPLVGGAENAIKGITDYVADFHHILLTARLKKSLPKSEKMGNITVYRLGFGSRFDKLLLPFLSTIKFTSLKREFEQPILFWGMMASYGSLGAWLLKFFYPKIPFLLTIQEGDREWERNRFWWRVILEKVDYVTAISSFLLIKVREMGYRGKAEIIPNGVDLNRFANKDLRIKNGQAIISVSRRVHKNGIDILEKAFEIVKKKFPDAELRIISDAKHEDVPRYLHEAYVFVRPSRSEGLGISFLEAMAAGLPIIATSVGGIRDFLIDRETGLEIKVDDPEDLAKKIELLFTDKALRERLVKNGLKLVEEKYQWSKIARDMNKIFLELCGF